MGMQCGDSWAVSGQSYNWYFQLLTKNSLHKARLHTVHLDSLARWQGLSSGDRMKAEGESAEYTSPTVEALPYSLSSGSSGTRIIFTESLGQC